MDSVVVHVREDNDIAVARRATRDIAARVGMDRYTIGEVETSTSELAANLVRYAPGGSITVERVESEGRVGVRVTSTDQGPDITNLDRAMEEGYSTSGTLGVGLPGVKRMMDEFEITSEPGAGTSVVTVKWLR